MCSAVGQVGSSADLGGRSPIWRLFGSGLAQDDLSWNGSSPLHAVSHPPVSHTGLFTCSGSGSGRVIRDREQKHSRTLET